MANFLDKKDKSMVPMPNSAPIGIAEKFGWARATKPGVFMMINKNLLNLDDEYQRHEIKKPAVLRIARTWDWMLFAVLAVVRRADGSYWVYDGGHRLRAAFYRKEILDLPCMVFECSEIADEARAFVGGTKLRNSISAADTFRAGVLAKEPAAVKAAEILDRIGIKVAKTARGIGEIKCIGAIQSAAAEDADLTSRVLDVCVSLAGDKSVSVLAFKALFILSRHFKDIDIISDYSETLGRLTQHEIERAIRSIKAETGNHGNTIGAKALMGLLNKGKRSRKLVWDA